MKPTLPTTGASGLVPTIRNRLALLIKLAHRLDYMLDDHLPPMHESRLAAKVTDLNHELTELVEATRALAKGGDSSR